MPEGVWRVRGSSRPDTVYGPYLSRSRLVARPGDGVDTCRSIETTPNEDLCETG